MLHGAFVQIHSSAPGAVTLVRPRFVIRSFPSVNEVSKKVEPLNVTPFTVVFRTVWLQARSAGRKGETGSDVCSCPATSASAGVCGGTKAPGSTTTRHLDSEAPVYMFSSCSIMLQDGKPGLLPS